MNSLSSKCIHAAAGLCPVVRARMHAVVAKAWRGQVG